MKQLGIGLGIAAAYFFAALAGLSLSFEHTNVSPVWPPIGIAFAALLLLGIRYWPGVTAGAFLANFFTGLSFPVSAGIAAGNTLEAICAVLIIRRFARNRDPLTNTHDLSYFFVAALTSTIVSATIGTAVLYHGGVSGEVSALYLWWTWWMGDSVGAIAFAPLLISWSEKTFGWTLRTSLGFGATLLVIAVAGLLPFSGILRAGPHILYASVPLIVFAAHQYQQKGASAAVVLMSLIVVVGTIHGNGPFLLDTLNESLLMLQTFIGVVAVTALVVAAVKRENTLLLETTHAQLKEKEVLLGEIHHRVKNNLQVISSLLGLQMKNADALSRDILRQNRNRVQSMALVHEKLYESPNLARVDFAQYVQDLARMIFDCYPSERVALKMDCESMYIGVDKAIPCGLILNEIITNSLKHAFPGSHTGEIRIMSRQIGDKVHFEIMDNGIGFPQGFDPETKGQLGMRLIRILTEQLHGSIAREDDTKAAYIFEFLAEPQSKSQ